MTPLAMGPRAAGRLLAATVDAPRLAAGGAYLDRGRVARSSAESYDRSRENDLWVQAARLCGLPAEQETVVLEPR